MSASQATWIFFDLGFTLLDESPAQRARLEEVAVMLSRRGIAVTAEELWRLNESASTAHAPNHFLAALSELGLPAGVPEEIRATAPYDHARERLYPGVPALLERLSASFDVGLIANQSPGTEARLRAHGIGHHFSVVAASAELELAKPDPAIFEGALARAGCSPDSAVMVGDRLDNDIAPAKRLGMRTVRVRQGFARDQQPRSLAETPDCTIGRIAELAGVLAKL